MVGPDHQATGAEMLDHTKDIIFVSMAVAHENGSRHSINLTMPGHQVCSARTDGRTDGWRGRWQRRLSAQLKTECPFHADGRRATDLGYHVQVDLGEDPRVGVAEPGLHRLEVDAGYGRAAVADVCL